MGRKGVCDKSTSSIGNVSVKNSIAEGIGTQKYIG